MLVINVVCCVGRVEIHWPFVREKQDVSVSRSDEWPMLETLDYFCLSTWPLSHITIESIETYRIALQPFIFAFSTIENGTFEIP